MADIYHDFTVSASPKKTFEVIATPNGLDRWWSLRSSGSPQPGATYVLDFGPGYAWEAVVKTVKLDQQIIWQMTVADEDWTGTQVGFELLPRGDQTLVRFHHTGWPIVNDHFRRSSYCWAMYLRILKRYIEEGETVAYSNRASV